MGTLTLIEAALDARIAALIDREGGYVNNKADLGGPTIWGVTEQVARAFGYTGDMRAMSKAIATTIYRKRYWLAPRLDAVSLRYPALATELFDIAVNMGPAVAGTFLQRSLNVFNSEASLYPDITVDGGIGTMTLSVLDSYRQRRGETGGDILLEAVCSLRGARYIEISEARPANEAFTYGWFGRMVEMLRTRLAR
jgi:lysozyme family protein